MAINLLLNGGFEADWSDGGSHRCLIVPADGGPLSIVDRGNIFTPPGWLTWFRHGFPVEHDPNNVDGWAQPEVRDAWISGDPRRVRSGQKAILYFTFFRIHDGGFIQQVQVQPGARLRLSAYAHAWSNHQDPGNPQQYPHPDNPLWSEGEGVGFNHFFALEGQIQQAAARNFTFSLGIDPTGGMHPYASTVVWGRGAHIYNAYFPVPPVEVEALSSTVTLFLRAKSLWPFKHCDAYWDDARLELVSAAPQVGIAFDPSTPRAEETVAVTVTSTHPYQDVGLTVTGPGGQTVPVTPGTATPPAQGFAWQWTFAPAVAGTFRVTFTAAGGAQQPVAADLTVEPAPAPVWGLPRVQYARTYVLLHPGAGRQWVTAILDSGKWDEKRWTIGGSADDAGIGALFDKRVIAINPAAWGDDLQAFFQQHYPGTVYVAVNATTPAQLRQLLESMD